MSSHEDPTPLKFSEDAMILAESSDLMTLLEATVLVCNKYNIPYDDVCTFSREFEVVRRAICNENSTRVVIEETVDLITPVLKEKLNTECKSRGLLKGHQTNSLL